MKGELLLTGNKFLGYMKKLQITLLSICLGMSVYAWQYTTAAAPTVWNTLNNAIYSGQVTVNNPVLSISHATPALNGVKVRLKATNSDNCESTSNKINIKIKNCGAITNPMLPNKAGKNSSITV